MSMDPAALAMTERGAPPPTSSDARYPHVDAYLATLPSGWSSFPTCEANPSLLLGLRDRGVFAGLALPPAIDAYISRPPTESGWIPEVISVGAFLAVRDARFSGHSGEADFLAWFQALNDEILDAQQRALAVTSPAEVLGLLSAAWAQFHHGTTMTLAVQTKRSAVITFAHPRHLFPAAWLESRRRMLASALVKSGAVQPDVRATIDSEYGAVFRLSWT